MKRRKNADDRLRRLERAAASGEASDLIPYWRAAIHAGQLPKHTRIVGTTKFGIWTLQLPEYLTGAARSIPRVLDWNFPGWNGGYDVYGLRFSARSTYTSESPEDVKTWLLQIIDEYETRENPGKGRKIRRNADDGIRRLERIAASGDFSAACRLTETRLRAGIMQPTRNFSNLLGNYLGIYDFCNGWSVWYGGVDVYIVLNEASDEASRGSHVPFRDLTYRGLYLSLLHAPSLADGKIIIGTAHEGRKLDGYWLTIRKSQKPDLLRVLQDVSAWPNA